MALAIYFFATGARTPLIAFLSFRRPRNVAAVVLPYIALWGLASLADDRALLLMAFAPAPLVAPSLARFVGAREETAGALMAGTVALSFVLTMANVPGVGVNANMALFAFVAGAAVVATMPTLRDAVLPVLDAARYLAIAFLLAAAAVTSIPLFNARDAVAALAVLAIGAAAGALGAAVFRGSALAGAIGGGTRDPAVAAGFAISANLAGAGAMALAYAVALVLGLVVARFVARKP